MARLRDFVPAIRNVGFVKFVVIICKKVARDQLVTQASAMAYAWLFAIFPFLLFFLTLFAYIPKQRRTYAENVISESVNKVLAHDAADTILTNLKQVLNETHGGLLGIGLVVTLWVASGGMSMTMTALDAAYDSKKTYPFYVQRPLAILLTIVTTIMIAIVLILLPVGTAIERWLTDHQYFPPKVLWALTLIRYGVAILLMLAVLCMLYTFGTRVRHRFSFVTPGAIFTVLVWIVLGESFRFYVDKFGKYQRTYGAVGGVAIILLFFYLDALVMLIGAEINSLINRLLDKTDPNQSPTKASP